MRILKANTNLQHENNDVDRAANYGELSCLYFMFLCLSYLHLHQVSAEYMEEMDWEDGDASYTR